MGAVILTLLLTVGLSACGGGSTSLSPQDALAQARAKLDSTSGVSFSLTTDEIPAGQTGPQAATGVINKSPAFKGEFTVAWNGITPTISVVAVGGVVYAQIPLTPGWQEINPSDYGVPDPAKLIDGESGIASFLPATTDVRAGEQTRGGKDNKEILTVYTGVIPGADVAKVISKATGEFDVSYTISDAGVLSQAVITGDFYGTGQVTTYTATIGDYDTLPEITKP